MTLTKPEIVSYHHLTDKQTHMVNFLFSQEQKRQMQDLTVITVLRSTIKALDKAISWWTEVDQKKKKRNYAIQNRHVPRSKGRKNFKWSKQEVSGYASTGNIPEYLVRKSSFSPQVLQRIALFYNLLWFPAGFVPHCDFPRLRNSKQRRWNYIHFGSLLGAAV